MKRTFLICAFLVLGVFCLAKENDLFFDDIEMILYSGTDEIESLGNMQADIFDDFDLFLLDDIDLLLDSDYSILDEILANP